MRKPVAAMTMVFCLALSGCTAPPAPAGAAPAPAAAAPSPAPAPAPAPAPSPAPAPAPSPAPVQDAQQFLPPEFTLSLPGPGIEVRVQGGQARVTQAGNERRLAITANDALFDGRLVMASDDAGTLELRVTQRLCQAPGAQATWPYTGRLVLDGGEPVTGCGGPLPDAR